MAIINTIIACVMVVLFASYHAEGAIGMNWGRQSAQRLLPSQVVDLLLQNGIGNARIYTSQKDILDAFAGSRINLTVAIFKANKFKRKQEALDWVNKNKESFVPCNIRSVYLGVYAFVQGLEDKAFLAKSWRSLTLLQEALNESGNGKQVKANFIHYDALLKPNVSRPSEAEFIDEIKPEMLNYLRYLQENDAPFPIELFPIAICVKNNFDLSFAVADNKSDLVITDVNGAVYNNLFEWQYDCFVWAINKLANATNIKVVVSQIGWPTDGLDGANAANAERFFKHLLPLVTSNKGTPMRPGAPIDVNLHSLTDENKMLGGQAFSRHWGIYRSNGQPKYKIDLTGHGRDVYPTTVKGIMRMPNRWCVLKDDVRDWSKVKWHVEWACNKSDCTSAAPGGSCSRLSFERSVTYAFNMYFQYQFQNETACDFDGLGHLSDEDPSTDECVFPVEVVKGLQVNFEPPSAGEGFRRRPHSAVLTFVWLVSMLVWI